METFSSDWLALREPADHAARAERLEVLVRQVLGWRPALGALDVVDLGAGTGSNLRHLASRLPGPQRWHLVDHDASLLAVATARIRQWSAAPEYAGRVELHTYERDLTRLADVPFPTGGPLLVTGAALLDLTSTAWLAALASRCRQAGAVVLFPLVYDGRIECRPQDPFDEAVREAVNGHQRTDKGFGPAAGPDASAVASSCLVEEGYTVRRVSSDWQLDDASARLQHQLVEGWADAATAIEPRLGPEIAAWRARRIAYIAEGVSRIRVGHEDLAGWLAPTAAGPRRG